jgi:hypothetical protein
MARDFRRPERRQGFLLPPDMRDWLPQDDIVHLVLDAVSLSDRLTMAWPDAAGDDSSSGCGPERPEAGWPSLAGRRSAIRLT